MNIIYTNALLIGLVLAGIVLILEAVAIYLSLK